MWRLTHWKRPWCCERLKAGGEGDDRGWDVGWHHRLDEHEFEWTPGVGDGQGGLACWSQRVGHDWATELNWTETLCLTSSGQSRNCSAELPRVPVGALKIWGSWSENSLLLASSLIVLDLTLISFLLNFLNMVLNNHLVLELEGSHTTFIYYILISSVLSDSATPWTAAHQTSLSITNSRSLPKHMSIELAMPSNHLILCYPFLLLPSIFSSIRDLSNESALRIRWPMYWSFSFNISPSNEYSGLISFRVDWLDLLGLQGTLKSLLQHHSSKASILSA